MGKAQLDCVVRHLRDLARDPATPGPTDGQLLERFAQQDRAAFEALVTRHAPLVLGVCRRTLHQPQDVEDAFQAVFLVLARKAGRLDRRASLSSWLFTVARLVALKMRAQRASRQAHEAKARSRPPSDPLAETSARELYAALDEELAKLPEKYRAPLLLCYLEGTTQDEAARRLGLSLATVKRRLEQGRESLRRRLTRRGLTLSAALFAVLLSQASRSAAGSALLIHSTIEAGILFHTHDTMPASISPQAVALAKEFLKTMLFSRLTTLSALLVGVTLALAGAGILGYAQVAADPPVSDPGRPPVPKTDPATGSKPHAGKDRYGDPLPAGAIARLGTVRFRHGINLDRIVFSPDGKLVASWDCFRGIVLWEVASGRLVREFPVGIDARALAFSPDGKTLAIPHGTAKDFVIGLFDVATGREIRQFKGERSNFPALVFSHSGKLLAASGYDGSLRLWDVATGRQLHDLGKGLVAGFQLHQDLAFSPDDKLLASASGTSPIVLWNVSTGENLRQFQGHPGLVYGISFAPDGNTLISAGDDALRLWDVATCKEISAFGEKCGSACISRDGKLLASSHTGGVIRLWDVAKGKPMRQWQTTGDSLRAMAFSPDGTLLATGGGDSALHLWDVATAREVHPSDTHRGIIRALAFEPDGTTLLAGSSDALVCRWDLATQAPRHSCPCVASASLSAIAFAPDRRTFATAELAAGSGIRICDLATGKVQRTLGKPAPGGTRRLAYSPDGRSLASAGTDPVVHLWDLSTGKEVRPFHGPKALITCLAISPDGRVLAALNWDQSEKLHRVHLWEMATGKELGQPARESAINAIAFSLDARMLAVAGQGPGIELWEVQSGTKIHRIDWAESSREWFMTQGWTSELAFSNDGLLLASGGSGKRREDCAIRMWNVATGQEVCRFEGPSTAVTQLVFSPDDARLASGQADSTIVLWDVSTRRIKIGLEGQRLSAEALKAGWDDLAGMDAAKAYPAIWTLAAAPEDSVRFLKGRLAPVGTPKEIDRLIADLDSDRFPVREQATRELDKLGFDAEASLSRALESKPSLETQRRLERLLHKLESSPDWLRCLRAIQILEYIATPEARTVLQSLAQGAAGSRLTREAKASLTRLANRPSMNVQ